MRELSDYVRRFLYLDLGNVPWALDDAELVPESGGCSACPKRTGSNPSLFTDMQHDICTDRACFEKKMQAHIQKRFDSQPGLLAFSEYVANHKKDSPVQTNATCRRIWNKGDKCESAEGAIFVDGNDRGKSTFVCRNKDCPKHGLQARQTAAGGDDSAAASRKKHKIEKMFRQKLFSEISNKINSLPDYKVTRIVARAMWRRVSGDSKRAMLKAAAHEVPRESVEQCGDRMIEKATPVELGRLMVCMAIADELMVSTYGSGKAETMLKFADAYGIDVKQVRDGPKNGPARKLGAKELKKRKKARAAA